MNIMAGDYEPANDSQSQIFLGAENSVNGLLRKSICRF
jgi:hypothetical protein